MTPLTEQRSSPLSIPTMSKSRRLFLVAWMTIAAVYLGWIVILSHRAAPPSEASVLAAWWDQRTGMRYSGWGNGAGGILGAVIGTLGGVIGSLAGAGRARATVMSLVTFTIIACFTLAFAGFAAVIVGLVARLQGQPHWVFFPFLQLGGVCTLVFGGLAPHMAWMKTHVLARRYEEIELRKIKARDAG